MTLVYKFVSQASTRRVYRFLEHPWASASRMAKFVFLVCAALALLDLIGLVL